MKVVILLVMACAAVWAFGGFTQRTAQRVTLALTPQGEKIGAQVVWQREAAGKFILTLLQKEEKATIRLFGPVPILRNPRTPAPRLALALERESYLAPAMRSSYRGEIMIPANLANGIYDVEAELEGGQKTPRVRIRLVDPPVRILGVSGGDKVGDDLTIFANYAPPNARILVSRLKTAPFPDEWWAPHKSVGSSSSLLTPVVTKDPDGRARMKVKMPVSLGAGQFQTRIQGGTALTNSGFWKFNFEFPASAPAVYRLRLDSIQCLEETNEIGDDEIYALSIYGRIRRRDEPGFAGAAVKRNGPMSFEKGQRRVLNSHIFAIDGPVESNRVVWAVALMENDDDGPAGYELAVQHGNWNEHLRDPYNRASLGGTIIDAIHAQKEKFSMNDNNDEFLGWKPIPLTEADIRTARTKEGWIPRSVVVEGDGGRYRLTFSVSAAPKQG